MDFVAKFRDLDTCNVIPVQTLRRLETEYSAPAYARLPGVTGSQTSAAKLLNLEQLGENSLSCHDFKLSAASAGKLHEPHILYDPANKLLLIFSALRLVTRRCGV